MKGTAQGGFCCAISHLDNMCQVPRLLGRATVSELCQRHFSASTRTVLVLHCMTLCSLFDFLQFAFSSFEFEVDW